MHPREFKDWLVSVFPDFERYWESGDNYSKEGEDYSLHGVCNEFSNYYREHYRVLAGDQQQRLFGFVEECVANDPDDRNPLANALCTCFLENIAGEASGEAAVHFMGNASREYYIQWVG